MGKCVGPPSDQDDGENDESDDDDVGPGPPPLQRGASLAGRLVERGGFPYPQHCELSSHLALEGKRRSGGEKFGMRTSKKSAQFTLLPSGRGILKHDSGKIKGPTATSPPPM